MYRVLHPHRGWGAIAWLTGTVHSAAADELFARVAAIPGCTLNPLAISIPETVWMLDDVQTLCTELDVGGFVGTAPIAAHAWMPIRALYPHQDEAVRFACDMRGVIIADEMGLGKTTEAIVAAERIRLSKYARPGVIVGPLAVRNTWLQELLAVGAIDDASQFCALQTLNLDSGSFRSVDSGVRWYFLHYELARVWWARLNTQHPAVVVVDEAHWIRNSRASRSKGTLLLAGVAERRILLTGTPLDNRPSDLWFPLTVACGAGSWGSPLEFRQRYCGATFSGFGHVDGAPTHIAELRERLAPYYLRRTAQSVGLDLPRLTRQSQLCPMPPHFQHQHEGILRRVPIETLVRAIASGVVAGVLEVLTALRQITSRAKVPATAAYVSNALDQGESVVVFCWERDVVAQIAKRIVPAEAVLTVTGEDAHAVRVERISRFQTSTQPMALIATLGTLREGVTLHAARIVVQHDLDWVLSHLLQAEKRIHRIGQNRACQSVWMLAEHSIDTLLVPILLRKAALMQDVLGIDDGVGATEELDLASLVQDDDVDAQVQRALQAWGSL